MANPSFYLGTTPIYGVGVHQSDSELCVACCVVESGDFAYTLVFRRGTTWNDFVNTECNMYWDYNTETIRQFAEISENEVHCCDEYRVVVAPNDFNAVMPTDEIINGHVYGQWLIF